MLIISPNNQSDPYKWILIKANQSVWLWALVSRQLLWNSWNRLTLHPAVGEFALFSGVTLREDYQAQGWHFISVYQVSHQDVSIPAFNSQRLHKKDHTKAGPITGCSCQYWAAQSVYMLRLYSKRFVEQNDNRDSSKKHLYYDCLVMVSELIHPYNCNTKALASRCHHFWSNQMLRNSVPFSTLLLHSDSEIQKASFPHHWLCRPSHLRNIQNSYCFSLTLLLPPFSVWCYNLSGANKEVKTQFYSTAGCS